MLFRLDFCTILNPRQHKQFKGYHEGGSYDPLNPLNAELNPICHLPALLGAQHILYVSRVRVNTVIPRLTSDPANEFCG